jgi:hypothetical protein
VTHVVVAVYGWNDKLALLNPIQVCSALLEDTLHKGSHNIFPKRTKLFVIAILFACFTDSARHHSVVVIEEVSVAILTDIQEPFGASHGIVIPEIDLLQYLMLEMLSAAQGGSAIVAGTGSSSVWTTSTGVEYGSSCPG